MSNEANKTFLRKLTEAKLREAAKSSLDRNKDMDDFFLGHVLLEQIANRSKNYRQSLIDGKNKLGLSEDEINQIVDDATEAIIAEFIS
ncbi:MAG: hypothetical protein HUJ22_02240 [Gracilimonas sp.]|uniref:hypothetical protein n=1 Tax=Gracilimonas sp. TaxID=1974203 RepID=UPI001999370F|nr:hypothetical protein [Gracilimonas sp.]MBD3615364.1 hypothetical protein [Gracilimonas sp.]